jgi:hypothetical protein
MRNSTTHDQQENQEQGVRTSYRRMHYRSSEYEVGGEELEMEKNGEAF